MWPRRSATSIGWLRTAPAQRATPRLPHPSSMRALAVSEPFCRSKMAAETSGFKCMCDASLMSLRVPWTCAPRMFVLGVRSAGA
eukprot:9300611-Alexandrium_andersonii.AAC.1